MKVTNYAPGARGINLKGGATLFVEPGQTVEFDKDQVVGDLPDFGKESDQAAQPDRVADLESQLSAAQARITELELAAGATAGAPVGLTGKSKAQLLDIAKAEGVDIADDATNAQIVEAIEAKRAA